VTLSHLTMFQIKITTKRLSSLRTVKIFRTSSEHFREDSIYALIILSAPDYFHYMECLIQKFLTVREGKYKLNKIRLQMPPPPHLASKFTRDMSRQVFLTALPNLGLL
jgi:hypothetical protein